MSPVVSIILCTRDRADSLKATLQSIVASTVPDDLPTEIIIVDNGSSDHTRELIPEIAKKVFIPIKLIVEPQPGKSFAYNSGLSKAAGDIFLSTDDDVRVPRDWIDKMCRPIFNDHADIVQGGIEPAEHLQRPWLKHSFLAVSATLIVQPPPARPTHFVGANVAFSRKVLNAIGGFDPILGPGSRAGLGEDTLFGFMAREARFRMIYSDFCSVAHHFDPSRLEPENVIGVARKLGRTFALTDYHWHHDTSKRSKKKLILLQAKLAFRKLLPPWHTSFIKEWRFCYEMDLEYQLEMSALKGSDRRYQLHESRARLT